MTNINYDKVLILDCGKNNLTYYNSQTDEESNITREETLRLPEILEEGFTVIGEASHFSTPRGEYSLAQPFYAEELLDWYYRMELNNISLKMFPQKSTPRAYAKVGKSDETDPKAIFNLLKKFPEICLMNPPNDFNVSKKIQRYWKWKDTTNKILNIARMTKYNLNGEQEDKNTDLIVENIDYIYNSLTPEERECFQFTTYKNNKIKIKTTTTWQFSMSQIYSILACIRDHHGNLRKNAHTDRFPSNKDFRRYLLCLTPFHFRGGVARSNLYYHGLMNYIQRKGKEQGLDFKRKVKLKDNKEKTTIRRGSFTSKEDEFFVKHRIIYNNAIMSMYKIFKSILEEDSTYSEEQEHSLILSL